MQPLSGELFVFAGLLFIWGGTGDSSIYFKQMQFPQYYYLVGNRNKYNTLLQGLSDIFIYTNNVKCNSCNNSTVYMLTITEKYDNIEHYNYIIHCKLIVKL